MKKLQKCSKDDNSVEQRAGIQDFLIREYCDQSSLCDFQNSKEEGFLYEHWDYSDYVELVNEAIDKLERYDDLVAKIESGSSIDVTDCKILNFDRDFYVQQFHEALGRYNEFITKETTEYQQEFGTNCSCLGDTFNNQLAELDRESVRFEERTDANFDYSQSDYSNNSYTEDMGLSLSF